MKKIYLYLIFSFLFLSLTLLLLCKSPPEKEKAGEFQKQLICINMTTSQVITLKGKPDVVLFFSRVKDNVIEKWTYTGHEKEFCILLFENDLLKRWKHCLDMNTGEWLYGSQ